MPILWPDWPIELVDHRFRDGLEGVELTICCVEVDSDEDETGRERANAS